MQVWSARQGYPCDFEYRAFDRATSTRFRYWGSRAPTSTLATGVLRYSRPREGHAPCPTLRLRGEGLVRDVHAKTVTRARRRLSRRSCSAALVRSHRLAARGAARAVGKRVVELRTVSTIYSVFRADAIDPSESSWGAGGRIYLITTAPAGCGAIHSRSAAGRALPTGPRDARSAAAASRTGAAAARMRATGRRRDGRFRSDYARSATAATRPFEEMAEAGAGPSPAVWSDRAQRLFEKDSVFTDIDFRVFSPRDSA